MMTSLWLALSLASPAHASEPEGQTSLVVHVRNVEEQTGGVYVILFNNADAFPNKPDGALDSRLAPAKGDQVTVTFDKLPAGTYALFAFHDVNDNKDLDVRAVIPIPKEPVAASRDAKGRMGPPKFKDAAFTIPTEGEHVEVLNLGSMF